LLFEASFYSDRNLFTEKIDFFSLNLKKSAVCFFNVFKDIEKSPHFRRGEPCSH
jgi:hypothetical protein